MRRGYHHEGRRVRERVVHGMCLLWGPVEGGGYDENDWGVVAVAVDDEWGA